LLFFKNLWIREVFFARYEEHLRTGVSQRQAYYLTEDECEAQNQRTRYADFESFRQCYHRYNKNSRKK